MASATVRISDVPPLPGPYFESERTATNLLPAGKVRGKENELVGEVMFW